MHERTPHQPPAPAAPDPSRVLKAEQAALRLGLAPRTVYDLMKTKKLASLHRGRNVFTWEEAVAAYAQRKLVVPPPAAAAPGATAAAGPPTGWSGHPSGGGTADPAAWRERGPSRREFVEAVLPDGPEEARAQLEGYVMDIWEDMAVLPPPVVLLQVREFWKRLRAARRDLLRMTTGAASALGGACLPVAGVSVAGVSVAGVSVAGVLVAFLA